MQNMMFMCKNKDIVIFRFTNILLMYILYLWHKGMHNVKRSVGIIEKQSNRKDGNS